MKITHILYVIAFLFAATAAAQPSATYIRPAKNDIFTLQTEKHGLSGIWKTNDIYNTNYLRRGKVLGEAVIRYKDASNRRDSIKASTNATARFIENGTITRSYSPPPNGFSPLEIAETYNLSGDALTWQIDIINSGSSPITIDEFAVPLYYNNQGGENPKDIFEQRVIKHHFFGGNSSYIFWERPTGVGPYLVMTPLPGTKLEYFDIPDAGPDRGIFHAFIYSSYTASQKKGTWRQPNSSLKMEANASQSYGFKFRWAKDYAGIRDILFEEGLVDVRVTPGMTMPTDLETTIALHCKYDINSVTAEFPKETTITPAGTNSAGMHLYKIKFNKLGENIISVRYNGQQFITTLEFFVTEPLDVLYKKRASFIVNSQQHKDHSKWYDGLFSQWDMKNKVLRGPDNTDGFDEWWGYVLSCDDPGLCKAPFLAAKNVFYPNQKEIDAIEYYLEHFVWGKLQRTDKEKPYPYGIYGTPNWWTNRDTARRRLITRDKNQDKEHIWRSYDYPHIMMLYYHMYQVATMYPQMTHYLDKKGYLERAKETAKAYFIYPYEILPWYETYKWGCYNELLLVDLMKDLEREGFAKDAQWLRQEWEKKAKYFIYDDPYPFRSEYAVDATAYESTHALAKYAVENPMKPDSNLWFDKNRNVWYSHPKIQPNDARQFMERQLQANIACRGWLEPAYYLMGSDFRGSSDRYLLSYMSQMGGWSILDYALHYAKDPNEYLGLGYASYLSAFALMNTGPAGSNYGYWYPGKENDGATGWAYEPRQYATTWIRKSQGRGSWFYDGEIDLGYGGATRMAATVIANDPVFGWIAYGGSLQRKGNVLEVAPKDGLGRRLYYRNGNDAIDIEINRDGFAHYQSLQLDAAAGYFHCILENRTSDAHEVTLSLKGFPEGTYTINAGSRKQSIRLDGKQAAIAVRFPAAKTMTVSIKKN